ncbi:MULTISPECIES: DAK2 domain-containing protein [Actinomyces]|uniref:DAK2 domain-containing protein n=1 Tax=Actinomyces respiraculi TaxID=2744574 RepID=A0A7T0LJ50_9ACTO|nr:MULTISPECIES: DAK2 domain-containing protein [Actinomyces]QPL04711.1 DAK2 domain-containing protein [Actinomyces respiraculi]
MTVTGTRTPPPVLDARTIRSWMSLAVRTATRTRELIDGFNVFPVPDADTGSNVLLTLTSAAAALDRLPRAADAAQATRTIADGAVRGARGNSGLLVSQALAALAEVAADAPTGLRPVELVHAYEAIASSTWEAVSRPVTGTLLTVAADAAQAARALLDDAAPTAPPTVGDIAGAAALSAQESVVETAGTGHGPVDAGGAALMLMLTALCDVLSAPTPGAQPDGPLTAVAVQMLTDLAASSVSHGSLLQGGPASSTGEFEVMYLLEATAAQATALRHQLERVGDSVGVVGAPDALGVGLYQVHVHTNTPRAALPRTGRCRQVCIHHLHPTALALGEPLEAGEPPLPYASAAQASAGHVISFERLASRRRLDGVGPQQEQASGRRPSASPATERAHRVGVIACTRAPGLIEQLARTGAVVLLDPDREGVLRAVGDLGLPQVLVLPCDADSAARAHEAGRRLSARTVPSTVCGPAGAATPEHAGHAPTSSQLLVADTDDEARVLAASVAVATRTTGTSLTDLALFAGRAGEDMRTLALDGEAAEADAVASAVAALLRPDDELLTVILGRDALPDVGALAVSAAERAAALTGTDPVEVVVHAGGQAHPDVLIAIE